MRIGLRLSTAEGAADYAWAMASLLVKQHWRCLGAGLGLIVASLGGACEQAGDRNGSATAPARSPAERSARVVSLSPLASRFVLQLGAGSLLVGVDAVSGRLAGLETLPEVDLAGAAQLAPDIVVLAALPTVDDPVAQPLVALGAELVEFHPEDLEDISALYKGLGVQLVGSVAALRAEAEMLRRLARIGGSSFGQRRPRTLAIVGLDPFLLAGAHSFETDLIEIAGGNSVTHTDGGEEFRIESSPARLDGYAPELLLVLTPEPLSSEQRRALLEMLGDRYPPSTAKPSGSRIHPRRRSGCAR